MTPDPITAVESVMNNKETIENIAFICTTESQQPGGGDAGHAAGMYVRVAGLTPSPIAGGKEKSVGNTE